MTVSDVDPEAAVLGRIRIEKPQIWTFITGHGALWQEQHESLRGFG